ncbi:proton-conducting transporter membrane subunit [Vreelandella rituensis]|nr:proton-conducting transporter membrane subunit [Halomonas rituensis]
MMLPDTLFANALWFNSLLSLALLWPLLLAVNVTWRHVTAGDQGVPQYLDGWWLSAPWPALGLVLLGNGQWILDGWILGGQWELTALSRAWLMFTALLWALAALHARGYFAHEQAKATAGDAAARRRLLRLAVLWPLTLAGNILLIVAQDIASFYLGFSLMTFAAYALVIHDESERAVMGAHVYLIMAVLGEGMILGGFLWVAGEAQVLTLDGLREGIAQAPHGVAMAALLWGGFGIKAGVIGLHVWLPLAHPAAPAPASAVLSGAMIKAGLLGWLNVLPLGNPLLSEGFLHLGQLIMVAGLLAAFGAAIYGVMQRHPKAVLAYSSISQMGMMTALVATGLTAPDNWHLVWPALVLFVAHHALAKGALFMGTSISEHLPAWPLMLMWALLALPGLSLVGTLGAGMASKWGFKSALYDNEQTTLIWLLSLAAIGTAALVSVALWRQWQQRQVGKGNGWQLYAWLATLGLALMTPVWLPLPSESMPFPPFAEWPGLVWPLPLGVVAAGLMLTLWRPKPCVVPAGDLWWLYAALGRAGANVYGAMAQRLYITKAAIVKRALAMETLLMQRLEQLLATDAWMRHHASGLMMALAVGLVALLAWESILS